MCLLMIHLGNPHRSDARLDHAYMHLEIVFAWEPQPASICDRAKVTKQIHLDSKKGLIP